MRDAVCSEFALVQALLSSEIYGEVFRARARIRQPARADSAKIIMS